MNTLYNRPNYGNVMTGSAYPMVKTGGTMDDLKAFLDKESLGIKGLPNKYVLAGAAALGLVWYGYKHHWF